MRLDSALIEGFVRVFLAPRMDALKAIQPLRKKYPEMELSLLVTEGCMPHCPFKVEHDTMNKEPEFQYWKNQVCMGNQFQFFDNMILIECSQSKGNQVPHVNRRNQNLAVIITIQKEYQPETQYNSKS